MAVDLALLHGQLHGSPPTLRLYHWQQPTISLGAGQNVPLELLQDWQAAGLAVVRRPTGGRAVLHGFDLTYSITAGPAAGLPPSLPAVYRAINAALQRGLASLGVATAAAARAQVPGRGRPLDCFSLIAPGDLLWQGRKLCGSAQYWRELCFLQHGSLLLSLPPASLLALLTPGPCPNPGAAVALEEILIPLPPRSRLLQALIAGFKEHFELTFFYGDLSPQEKNFLKDFSWSSLLL